MQAEISRWYAKTNAETAIADAPTFGELLAKVDALGIWNKAPGSVAPYYLTTIPPHPKKEFTQ